MSVHPGAVVKEKLREGKISQQQLAYIINERYTCLNELLNGKRPMTAKYALKFDAAIGVDADMLMQMQAAYNLYKARQNLQLSDDLAKIRKLTL